MKFIVDKLPYYREDCPFEEMCRDSIFADTDKCPRYWNKYKICSTIIRMNVIFLSRQTILRKRRKIDD